MHRATAMAIGLFVTSSVQAQLQSSKPADHRNHDHQAMEASPAEEAPIKITINPEARVSVARGGDLPPAFACGKAMELPIKIVNQGFVTAPLETRLVDSIPEGVSVELTVEPLKGTPEEHRMLRVTLNNPGPVDITVAFRAKNDISDLGGRDRIHLLLECLRATE